MNLEHIKYQMNDPELSELLEQSSKAFSADPDHHVTNIDLEIILEVSTGLKGDDYIKYWESLNI